MRKSSLSALAVLLIAGLTLTGCATTKYVDEQVMAAEQRANTKIGEVQTQVETNQAEIGKPDLRDDG